MASVTLFPYKNGSEGAKALADRLGILQIKKEGSRFKGRSDKLVINWGNSMSTEEVDKCAILNKPAAVAICSNKLSFFKHIQKGNEECGYNSSVFTPAWSTSRGWAVDYANAGHKIVCRTVLNGHSGEGIIIAERADQVVVAPLYVMYQPKKSEYRVHVLAGKVVDVQRKARDTSVPDDQVNWQIRNHQFGFNFVRDEAIENIPRSVLTQAINAVKMVGLDFGAVDIIFNQKQNAVYVLEINTAPGLTGTTLEGYEARFKEVGDEFAKIVAGKRKQKILFDGQEVLADALMNFHNNFPEPVRVPNEARLNVRPLARPQVAIHDDVIAPAAPVAHNADWQRHFHAAVAAGQVAADQRINRDGVPLLDALAIPRDRRP